MSHLKFFSTFSLSANWPTFCNRTTSWKNKEEKKIRRKKRNKIERKILINTECYIKNTIRIDDVMNVTVLNFENCTFVIYLNLFEPLYFVTSRKSFNC